MNPIFRKGCLLLLSLLSGFAWADHSDQIQQVRIDGSVITIYGYFPNLAETRVLFGADEAPYRLEPKITNSSVRAIELQLPFQPVPGGYKLTIQETGETDLELAITIGDGGVSVLALNNKEEAEGDYAVSATANSTAPRGH